jgi:tetratricopeptide (TPR) repeat protein
MDLKEKEQSLKLADYYFRDNNYQFAQHLLDKVIKLDPNNSKANELLAYIFGNLGQVDISFELLNVACSQNDCSTEALYYLGSAQLKRCLFDQAIETFKKSIFKGGEFFEALHDLATAQAQIGDLTSALNNYQKCLKFGVSSHELFFNIARIFDDLKRSDEAIFYYDKALSLKSEYAEAWSNKGVTLHELKRFDEAIAHFDKALSLKPDYHEAWSNKGLTLHGLKRYDEAISHYDKALSLKLDYHEAWSNQGLTLHELKRYDEAIANYGKALSIKPDYHEAWSNKGLTLQELKRYDEAITNYDKALSLKPDYAEAWSNKGMLNLFLKKYQAGWENYDWRLKTKDFQSKMAIEGLVLWNGSNCKHLLIYSDQGVGDIIFYASILGIAKNKVENITISIDIRLIPILSRSFPEIVFIDKNELLDTCLYDAQISFGSLPVVLNMRPEMVGRSVPYLIHNNVLTRSINKQLKCGVAWKSNNQKIGKDKSILLSDLNDILQVDGYEFINLQYGDTQEEIKNLEDNYGTKLTTINGIDIFNNIDGVLSIIQTCDVIVTTSNLTAHLAGALGKITFLLVPYSAGRIWYWHEERISSWYPSISLYSQDQNFKWNGAIKNIASRLENEIFK